LATSIAGTIIAGQGDAHRNHAVLIPRLAAYFSEIENCRPFGTINMQLDQSLDRRHADLLDAPGEPAPGPWRKAGAGSPRSLQFHSIIDSVTVVIRFFFTTISSVLQSTKFEFVLNLQTA
jgi:hypothetical protein